MDVSRYARFERPGHAVTGDRSQRSRDWMQPGTRVGYDYAHAVVDDHSRLAYVELHDDEKAATVTAFMKRALAFYERHGIIAKRVMTDNAFTYVMNRSLAELLTAHDITHLKTEPYRPRTNGKVERFHQTMAREWGYGLGYLSHRHRAQALPHWLGHYNQHRPHSSLGRPTTDQPRSQRVRAGHLVSTVVAVRDALAAFVRLRAAASIPSGNACDSALRVRGHQRGERTRLVTSPSFASAGRRLPCAGSS